MSLPGLFGVVAAIGIGCGLVFLLFSRPMRRLEEGDAPLAVEGSASGARV
jgi:hypothetical protein